MAAHDCACLNCRGVDLPAEPIGEQHLAVRFRHCRPLIGNVTVTLDGVDVSTRSPEVLAGDDGWAVVFPSDDTGRRHRCARCRRSMCAELVHGRVQVVTHAAA